MLERSYFQSCCPAVPAVFEATGATTSTCGVIRFFYISDSTSPSSDWDGDPLLEIAPFCTSTLGNGICVCAYFFCNRDQVPVPLYASVGPLEVNDCFWFFSRSPFIAGFTKARVLRRLANNLPGEHHISGSPMNLVLPARSRVQGSVSMATFP